MKFRIFFSVLCATTPFFIYAAEIDFSRALKLGMRGDDVRALQQVLNSDADTRVAEHGDGSPGNETNYFGAATKRALVKFQEKYSKEILAPAGLVSGTGVFGANTRTKMTAIRNGQREYSVSSLVVVSFATSTRHSAASSSVVSEMGQGEVFVMSLSQYSGKVGTMLTVGGSGFTTIDNTIYFGATHAIEHAISRDGQTITFEIPSIPKGMYHLYVKNARGESDHAAFFVVTDGVTPEPTIDSVTYDSSKNIVIRGSGFTATDNVVRTGVGVYERASSVDGKTITVLPVTMFASTNNLPKATIFTSAPKEIKRISVPVDVIVANDNGVSNNRNFTLEL